MFVKLFYVATVTLLASGIKARNNVIDNAIENIDLHYSDKLCLDILLIDCSRHVTVGDEMICGTDGRTYANHCSFAHAKCEFPQVNVQNHGPCPATTTTVPTTTLSGDKILLDVFCRSANTISCASSPMTPVCATNGRHYPNMCEFLKDQCRHPSITLHVQSNCAK